ncbi:RNA chaperone Hfq [Desulfosporosinus sp. SB140]|uniref:RNA chaperone Hfq n=1 Tax=Desulfosporosinus paludis TaxID=3115649 RepID=UPI00388FA96A
MVIKSKLQDAYLEQLQTTKTPVIVHLIKGLQFRGIIIGSDSFTIMLEFEGKQQMLFKQMISTISPTSTCQSNRNNPRKPSYTFI